VDGTRRRKRIKLDVMYSDSVRFALHSDGVGKDIMGHNILHSYLHAYLFRRAMV
jgi:hypothetical protein